MQRGVGGELGAAQSVVGVKIIEVRAVIYCEGFLRADVCDAAVGLDAVDFWQEGVDFFKLFGLGVKLVQPELGAQEYRGAVGDADAVDVGEFWLALECRVAGFLGVVAAEAFAGGNP